ncbi:MAG: Na/Pi cotransporter family protein [Kiritimatiellae bacterium]|nr:Na/Pi cotransporter family protein [Kiritimatiellia bacterium]
MIQQVLTILVTVLGGLGIFLLGMKHLSEGLQAAAGEGLRRFMSKATGHRIVGVGTGIVSTIIVQSSSIITVMLVGFVSTAIMTLPQAFAVLIGANIGTTATVWIMAYAPDPQLLGFVGIATGSIMYFFCRGEKIHHLGLTIIGLGLVFLGMFFMKEGVTPIKENPAIATYFQSMSAENYFGIIKVALVAMVLTAVIQSSAATIMIAMTMANQGLISYEVAIACLFGANIGTTATGWLAAIGASADAKRTALSHTLSNIIGSVVLIWFFPLFTKIHCLIPSVMGAIAITDTVFAVCRGIIFFPIVRPFAKFIEKIIKQPENEKPHLSALKLSSRVSPVLACDQSLIEIDFMKKSNLELLECIRRVLNGNGTEADERHVAHREEILDNVQKEITEFLGSIMSKRLAQNVSDRARRLLRFSDDLESVSDECAAIIRVVKRLRSKNETMSEKSVALLLDIHDRLVGFAADITPLIRSPRPRVDLHHYRGLSRDLHEYIRECRLVQLGRVGREDPGSSVRVLGELDILNSYERMRSYYLNMVETLAGGKGQ